MVAWMASTSRPIGLFESIVFTCSSVICASISVRAAAGATEFTTMPRVASSLPRDFVIAITAALDAE